MKTYDPGFQQYELATDKEPRFVVQISWDSADTDYTYLTSSTDANVPTDSPVVDTIHNAVLDISGQTQKINPDIATSTIGSVTVSLLDVTSSDSPPLENQVTTRINTKLDAGNGLRGKIVRVYVGYEDIPFTEYDLRLTYIVDSITYMDGVYKLILSDIQRAERHKIFQPDETNLTETILAVDTIIPVLTVDTSLFPAVTHGAEWAVRPSETVAYIKIEDEVLCITGGVSFDTTNGWTITAIERGALNTRAADHTVDLGTDDNRKPKIVEHIYLEGAAPKVINGLLTGLMHNYKNVIVEPFNFTQWSTSGTPVITATSDETPTGWGAAYSIEDDSAAAAEFIYYDHSASYIHGDVWSTSIFVEKQVPSTDVLLRLNFANGAASSWCKIFINPSTGVSTTSASAAIIVSSEAIDFDDNWYQLRISGYSTTTGTTLVQCELYPAVIGVGDTGACIVFGGALTKGESPGMTALPSHWHLGINESFVRLSDFQNLGVDVWDTTNDSGRMTRIENPSRQDGKRFIEKEILLWLGCFMPIYSTGELGIKKLVGILSDSSYQVALDKFTIKSYSALTHDMRSVINDMRIKWNWVDAKEEFTKESVFIDAVSIAKHDSADTRDYKFTTVHTGLHTDDDLLTYFDVLRDRYSGPPMKMRINGLPSLQNIEVGDVVNVELDQIQDFTKNTKLNRPFETQQAQTNWTTGALSLTLFGSSQRAGELVRTTLGTKLLDSYYTQAGTELSTVLSITAGAVTANGTLTGHASDIDNTGAIFYYDGDLTINAGVTVTVEENVQIRIKGALSIIGIIDGIGNGATGGAATIQFDNASTTGGVGDSIDYDYGEQGYYGIPRPPARLQSLYSPNATLPPNTASSVTPTNIEWGSINDVLEEVPWFALNNDQQTNTVTGYPADIRGNAGSGGGPYIHIGAVGGGSVTKKLLGNGGVGGNGGAGLLIVSRGMSFSGSGNINLTGGDGAVGTSYTQSTSDKFFGSSGAPGAPGALIILLDGEPTNPDIDGNTFIANYGDLLIPSGADEITYQDYLDAHPGTTKVTIGNWPYGDAVGYSGGLVGAKPTENLSVFGTAHRLQYIPEDLTPVTSQESYPDFIPGQYNDLLFFQRDDTPVIYTGYGRMVTITSDGSRFAVSTESSTGGVTNSVQIVRTPNNPIREQTITAGTGGFYGFGRKLRISEGGDRLMIDERDWTGTHSKEGAISIYSRSGVTWSLEQRLLSSTPATNGRFGSISYTDKNVEHIVVWDSGGVWRYWSRSGTTWTKQGVLAAPSTLITAAGSNLSDDGSYFVLGDLDASGSGGTDVGKLHVWKRSGSNWSLIVDGFYGADDQLYKWGARVVTDGAGVSFVTGDNVINVSYLQTFERIGDNLTLIQTLEITGFSSGDAQFPISISSNGLVLVVQDQGGGSILFFKRGATSQGWIFDQEFVNSGEASWGTTSYVGFSRNAKYIGIGDTVSDVGAADTGSVQLLHYIPPAE